MKTHFTDGKPYGTDDLIATFGERVVTMQLLTEFVGMLESKNERLNIVVRAVSILRDDWERFEEALNAELHREDAERAAAEVEA